MLTRAPRFRVEEGGVPATDGVGREEDGGTGGAEGALVPERERNGSASGTKGGGAPGGGGGAAAAVTVAAAAAGAAAWGRDRETLGLQQLYRIVKRELFARQRAGRGGGGGGAWAENPRSRSAMESRSEAWLRCLSCTAAVV